MATRCIGAAYSLVVIDGPMSREKVVIVGGGIAGLTCAFHLSKTPALRERFEVELLEAEAVPGGKLASTRDPEAGWRSLEHGLHVWFGFYDNAFGLVREVYDRWDKPADCPFESWRDAFRPHSFTPMGSRIAGEVGWVPVRWPTNADVPGDGNLNRTGWGAITQALGVFRAAVRGLLLKAGVPLPKMRRGWSPSRIPLLDRAFEGLAVGDVRGLRRALKRLDRRMRPLVEPFRRDTVDAHTLWSLLEVGVAFFLGLLDERWGVYRDWDLSRLDDMDLREWLVAAGGDEDVVAAWGGLKAVYDTTFQVREGKADFAAGVAARVILRICTQYNGAVLYHLNAGMGEVLISPLWEVLERQGVRLRSGTRLVGLNEVQTSTVDRALLDHAGLRVWNENAAPGPPTNEALLWDQLVLAVPVPAHKAEAWLQPLLSDDRFKAMVDAPNLVATEAAQVWMPQTHAELGWTRDAPALVGWPRPMSIWADMSHLLALSETGAGSLHYFCGAASGRDWQVQLDRRLGAVWPEGNWREGESYHRVNDQGSQLVVGSPAGAVRRRMGPESGIDRIWLAGAWTHNGIDASCVEGAVMSGMRAARALSGEDLPVVGEDFLWGSR